MANTPPPSLSPRQIWTLAARPKTLPAAAATAIVGSAVALHDGCFKPGPALAALLGALLLQIGANLANDVFDYLHGADTAERLGPLRVTQAGLLTPRQVLAGMWVTFGLAALLGLYLAWAAGWAVIVIGLLSVAAAVAYVGGPLPYGYYGLGDLFAFLFFGPVSVIGTYYVQAQGVSLLAVCASIPMGLLVTALLVVNNLRDIDTDRQVGKRTLAVRLGAKGARLEYVLCLIAAYAAPPVMWAAGLVSPWALLSWFSLALVPALLRCIYRQQGRPLNQALAGTGRLVLVYGLLFALGINI